MRILLLTYFFPPEIGSASHLFYELAESLTEKGYEIQVLTGFPSYNLEKKPGKYRGRFLMKEKIGQVKVIRIAGTHLPLSRKIALLRGIEHFWLSFVFFLRALFISKMDLILLYSPPLTLGITAWLLKKIKRVPFIINVQDLFPQNAIDLGILKNKILIRIFKSLEKFIYRKSSFITVHSEGNKKEIISKCQNPDKVKVIPNWVDTKSIQPGKRMNDFRKEYELGDKFIVSFAGVIGFSQGLEVVLWAASHLREKKDILFLIIGKGPEKGFLEKKSKEMKIENLKFLPMLSFQRYPLCLQASDICLVTLKKEVKTPVVPSKILSIMAAGRPIVAALFTQGEAAQLIREARAGVVVKPENPRELARAILELYENQTQRETLGKNGREYLEKNFSRQVCIQQYQNLCLSIIKK